MLRLSPCTVRRLIKDGTIPAQKIGRSVRIPEHAVAVLTGTASTSTAA